jgi:hypothetical protein
MRTFNDLKDLHMRQAAIMGNIAISCESFMECINGKHFELAKDIAARIERLGTEYERNQRRIDGYSFVSEVDIEVIIDELKKGVK